MFSAHSVSALNYTKPDQVLISVWFVLCGVKAPCSLVLTRLRKKHKALNFWESLLKVAQLKTNAKIHAQTWIYCWQKYISQIQNNCTLIVINSNLASCVVVCFFFFLKHNLGVCRWDSQWLRAHLTLIFINILLFHVYLNASLSWSGSWDIYIYSFQEDI